MGVGHLTRCLTLAKVLRSRDVHCQFICREHPGHLLRDVEDARMSVSTLARPPPRRASGQDNYAEWLGVSQDEDAADTIAAMSGETPDWLVIDHYGLDRRWERALRPRAARLMVIDDLANRLHDCDLLVDQNFSTNASERYRGLVPQNCTMLFGPRHAMLSPEYSMLQRTGHHRDGRVSRVFIFFGGSDPFDLTAVALEALCTPALRHLETDIVIGANYARGERLAKLAAGRPGTVLHGPRPHLGDLMSHANLALGAAGVTTWERMCIGLPAIVVSIAENQRLSAISLARAGLIQYLGNAEQVNAADIAGSIEQTMARSGEMLDQSERGQLLVDGFGALRVAECMNPTRTRDLCLRVAQPADAGLYFNWVNDPVVRSGSLNAEHIPWPAHFTWFEGKMGDIRSHLFVLEARSLPVGQIRFDLLGGVARIDYSIDTLFRGRGWGRILVILGMRRMAARERILFRAEVKACNSISAAVFARLGFLESESLERSDLRVFHFDSTLQVLPEID
jgi:UDP-2,4-diacetamido-2,4,6-trideoxy-beta-L-altropyranose hydrolase